MLRLGEQYGCGKFAIFSVLILLGWAPQCDTKLLEGQLKTLDDWAFLSRFCFISGRGRFEYLIEFEKRYGEPQLLLYYDDVSQWPSVYKTKTTCQQKVGVLSNSDHQIVTLTARPPHNYYSGCTLRTKYPEPKPPLPMSTPWPPHGGIGGADTVTSIYDQYLTTVSSSTEALGQTTETFAAETGDMDVVSPTADLLFIDDGLLEVSNSTGFNETEVFNATRVREGRRHGGGAGTMENGLENGTEFQREVEQMFADEADNGRGQVAGSVRLRRSMPAPMNFKRDGVGTVLVTCNNIGGFTSSRERWWYIAVANCGSRKGLDLKFKFRLTNGPRGDFWHEHFSADEMYILPIYLAETLIYCLLIIAVFICSIELRSMHLLHCTYRLFAFSVVLQWVGAMLQGIAYSMYGISGLAPRTLIGSLFMGLSEVCFLILVLLLAKGYTITRARISSQSAIKLTVFVNAYFVVYLSLFIFQAETFDPGEVLNLYESPAGIALAAMRLAAWAAFVVSSVNTLKKNPEKAGFYIPFGVLGSLWIMGGPLITVVGVTILDPWVRESVICFVLAAIAFGGHSAFLYLTWPSRANKSFPYHVRTNHVGIASTEDDGLDYPRHTYEPALAEQNTIIPLSRRTEELLSNAYGSYIIERNEPIGPRPHLSPRRPNYPRSPKPIAQLGPNVNGRDDDPHKQPDDDSGHPSLETSTSISPNDTVPPSAADSPTPTSRTASAPPESEFMANHLPSPNEIGFNPSSAPTFNGTTRPNPFVVNGIQRAPNKIILEPIERPLREGSATGIVGHNGVPRHLFAAKNPHNL